MLLWERGVSLNSVEECLIYLVAKFTLRLDSIGVNAFS